MNKGIIPAFLSGCLLAACSAQDLQPVIKDVVAFEQKAGPAIADGCARFHAAESNPLVGIVLGLANLPSAGAVSDIKLAGDTFCAVGPPMLDATSTEQRAQWILDLAAKLDTAIKS